MESPSTLFSFFPPFHFFFLGRASSAFPLLSLEFFWRFSESRLSVHGKAIVLMYMSPSIPLMIDWLHVKSSQCSECHFVKSQTGLNGVRHRGVFHDTNQVRELGNHFSRCGNPRDWLRFTLKSHRHHHPTDCNQASQISPGGASGDRSDGFPVSIGALARHMETTRNSFSWKTLVCISTQRKIFGRAKGDLQRIHDSSNIRATFPWRRQRLSMVSRRSPPNSSWNMWERAFHHIFDLFKVIGQDQLWTLRSSNTCSKYCLGERMKFYHSSSQQYFDKITMIGRPTSMILLCRASSTMQRCIWSEKLAAMRLFLIFITSGTPTQCLTFIWSAHLTHSQERFCSFR